MSQAGRSAFTFAFEISPILLTRGIAQNIPGGVLPIVALTDAASFATTLLTTNPFGGIPKFDSFFAHWYVLPGGTLQNQQVAMYPFANQAVAANAVIAGPLNVSMMMVCPARAGSAVGAAGGALAAGAAVALSGAATASALVAAAGGAVLGGIGGYAAKLAIFTALQKTIAQHNSLGGTYSVITPAYIYTDCVMSPPGIQDVSAEGETAQKQYRWKWDFVQPQVLTQATAAGVLNSLMQKLQQGLPLSGPSQVLGSAAGLAAQAVQPIAGVLTPLSGAASAALSLVPQ